jgi:hypothetical protein
MSDARTAIGFDRLPWLADEPQPPARAGLRRLSPWVVAAILLVAGASYWIGQQNVREPVAQAPGHPSTTVTLPEATAPPQPEVVPDRVPEVEPAIIPTVRQVPGRQVPLRRSEVRRTAKKAAVSRTPSKADAPAEVVKAPAPAAVVTPPPLKLWPSRQSAGAAGRLMQVGAFSRIYKAKRGWWAMVGAYPALKRLPTVVTGSRNSKGRHFYRLQIGTTSQAQSEVLCQRMEKIRYSCAVVGLPWKPKGVER